MKRIVNYLNEVVSELKNVTWPSRAQVVKLTVIVIVISGVVAAYTGGLDFALTKLLSAAITR